jgi:hypothetical protein
MQRVLVSRRKEFPRDGISRVGPRFATGFLSLEPSLLLKRLTRVVNSPKRRIVCEPTPDELIAARVRIDRADLKALGRMRVKKETVRIPATEDNSGAG